MRDKLFLYDFIVTRGQSHFVFTKNWGEKKLFNKDYIQEMSNALVLYWLNVNYPS